MLSVLCRCATKECFLICMLCKFHFTVWSLRFPIFNFCECHPVFILIVLLSNRSTCGHLLLQRMREGELFFNEFHSLYSTRNVYVIVSFVSLSDTIILAQGNFSFSFCRSANDFVNRRHYAFMFLRRYAFLFLRRRRL